ncbi:MAG: hypothetical protein JST11_10545 [Acidobacteria bacterium]|nr:hypothetical protein [Acidobacteriota bacterium]
MNRFAIRILLAASTAAGLAWSQGQTFYGGVPITGQLVLHTTVNLSQLAAAPAALRAAPMLVLPTPSKAVPLLRPPVTVRPAIQPAAVADNARHPLAGESAMLSAPVGTAAAQAGSATSVSVNPLAQMFGFSGLTHAQQLAANNGNQFSIEPPSQGLAVANGYVLEGVNNAVRVYTTSGVPLLSSAVSTNQVFGLPPAINRFTGVNGPFPTDIRVFYDHTSSRWFILQRAWDNDEGGINLPSSHLYLAVSQSSDPTGTYNVYWMDTTNGQNFYGCPCFPDYMQIGADQFGFYITANEYNAYYPYFVDATILAISKAALASGAATPAAFQFIIPNGTGHEFAIQPASTPPGASYFVANGGVEYFVSSQSRFSWDNTMAVWAMTNTSTLLTANPNLQLIRITIPTLAYSYPDVADQKSGPLPYGSTLIPPGLLAYLDGNDNRVLSLYYSGGRLYLTLATQVTDDGGRARVGGAYLILSPTLRAGVLAASVVRQGYIQVNGNHLLRPSIAVNPQGRGAIVVTLVGQDYYPSAAVLPIDFASTSTTLQIAGMGAGPEDGFSGYLSPGTQGVARWGDYAVALAAADGSIWMATEYIPPNAGPVQKANWGTYIMRYVP